MILLAYWYSLLNTIANWWASKRAQVELASIRIYLDRNLAPGDWRRSFLDFSLDVYRSEVQGLQQKMQRQLQQQLEQQLRQDVPKQQQHDSERDASKVMEIEVRGDYNDKGGQVDDDDYADIREMTPPLAPQECAPM